jgi:SAM-dependent methyltransferase
MSLVERIHGRFVHTRRVRVLCDLFAGLIPPGARVLDVGCGDGLFSSLLSKRRPDIDLQGLDVLVRPNARIPVKTFDGRSLPYANGSYDAVVFVDVLHHAFDPRALLVEAARVARQCVLIKDHLLAGPLAGPTLRLMDRVGNARYGVALPFQYWTRRQWQAAMDEAKLKVGVWQGDLKLYPPLVNWIFGRSLHFVARLNVTGRTVPSRDRHLAKVPMNPLSK